MDYESKKFYDAESSKYSEKRYEGALLTYTQYLFRTRLKIFLETMRKIVRPNLSLLEIGCADGVIMGKVDTTFSGMFQKLKGIDISPLMIQVASEHYRDPRFSFVLREQESEENFDVIIELGVHVEKMEEEIKYVVSHLKSGGHFIFSVAGKKSLHARIKIPNAPYVKDYVAYSEADKIIGEKFDIVLTKTYGFFIPKIWKFPSIARIVQPVADSVLRPFVPELFHEKIYFLRLKE
jgi:2-polyprenyl-3-methyl-5-hydroxy-6-metoxy-1,4-benzoquinol methylase